MSCEMYLDGSHDLRKVLDVVRYKQEFYRDNPDYFHPEGLLTFCGGQGAGKTISAVQYILQVLKDYPKCVFCTDVAFKSYPFNAYYVLKEKEFNGIHHTFLSYKSLKTDKRLRTVDLFFIDGKQFCNIKDYPENDGYTLPLVLEYDGLDCIKNLCNGFFGVLYYKDEIHLEFNSLESKNIPIEVMTEVSQQRKQRKHIVGTTQVYGRMAKAFREQLKNVVLCSNIFNVLQINYLIDGDKSVEKDGVLVTETTKKFIWFHTPELYDEYDTYAKMKRYRNEWKGRNIQ